jgi:hypothetical protein
MRNGRLTPAGGAANKAFAELIDVQRKQASTDAADDNQSLSRAQVTLLVIFGVAMAASMLALTWVLRSVLRQRWRPALVTEHMRRVAEGDLSRSVDTAGAAAGSLLGALAEMRAWPAWWARCARPPIPSRPAPPRSPPAMPICRSAPSSRRRTCSRPPRRWRS